MKKPSRRLLRLLLGLVLLAVVVYWLLPPTLPPAMFGLGYTIAARLDHSYDVHISLDEKPGNAWRSLRELEWTELAVARIATTLGGPPRFRRIMQGPVDVARYPLPELRAFAPPDALSVIGDIVLTDYNFDHGEDYAIYLIVHELGHVLDWRSGRGLSRRLIAGTGAVECPAHLAPEDCNFNARRAFEPPPGSPDKPYAATSSEEYWAEVFASATFPEYYGQDPVNNPVGTETAEEMYRELGEIGKK